MKKTELEAYVRHKAAVAEQVLIWLVCDIVRYRYRNSTTYLTKLKLIKDRSCLAGKKSGNYCLKEFSRAFHFDDWFIELICGGRPKIDGKQQRLSKQIIDQVKHNSKIIHYNCKKDVKFKSGKKFSHLGWWMLDTRIVAEIFSDKSYFSKNSSRYCDEAKYIISTIAFRYSRERLKITNLLFKKMHQLEKDTTMTKAEKDELKEKCENGLCGLPYDYLVKRIEKEEKAKLRTLQTRIRKMTQKAMAEIVNENEMLKQENAKLEAKVKHLEEMKDVNSDIPDDDIDYEKLNKELDEYEKSPKQNNVFVAPPELAEKKVETPVDDIPTTSVEEETKLERCLGKLQHYVDKNFISVREAREIAGFFNHTPILSESKQGFSSLDANRHHRERNSIFSYFKRELDKHYLASEESAKFFKHRIPRGQ